MKSNYITPQWPAPPSVKALVTTRQLGNLAVINNRQQLQSELNWQQAPIWLNQIHGNQVINLDHLCLNDSPPVADACYSHITQKICAILTADCLPILLCNSLGTEVAGIHAGWRGLLSGIIDETVSVLSAPHQLFVWLGPAIGPDHFEVNEDIRNEFVKRHPDFATGFQLQPNNRWFGNLYQLAKVNLQRFGVTQIFGGNWCTYCDSQQFFSYRRDQGNTGRMASLIWLC